MEELLQGYENSMINWLITQLQIMKWHDSQPIEKKNRYLKYRFLMNMQYSLVIVMLRHNCTPNSFLHRLISVANYWQYFVKKSQEEPASLKLRDKHATPESPLPPCPPPPKQKRDKNVGSRYGFTKHCILNCSVKNHTSTAPFFFGCKHPQHF